MTAFEELCQEWVLSRARAERLPFAVEQVGAHWGGGTQVDIAAINWHSRSLLLGEAKWSTAALDREVVQELIAEKTPKVLASLPESGEGWTVYHAFFARAGFTEAARALAGEHSALMIDLATLDHDLAAPWQ